MASLETSETMVSRRRRTLSLFVPINERVYVVPSANDVLRGRGGRTNTHPGNRRLLELVRPLEADYAVLKRGQKARKSQEIVDEVHAWDGRFLEKEATGDGKILFYVMDPHSAIKLVEQKFRDKPNKQKSRINRQSRVAKDKVNGFKDDNEDVMIVVDDIELLAFDEIRSLDTSVGPRDSILMTNSASSDPNSEVAYSFVNCVSPAHSLDDADIQMPSDDELDDFSLTEEEIIELNLDPQCTWGDFPSGAVVEDPSLLFSDDYLIELCVDLGDLFDQSQEIMSMIQS